jgi:superfamily II DNA or RNA helicase
MPPTPQRRLRFHAGTLLAEGATVGELPPGFVDDDRVGCPRAPAWLYADTVRAAIAAGAPFLDEARTWEPLPLVPTEARSPRPYQQAAVEAWVAAGRRGAILLPTGAGKTFVAELAMASTRRPTLVLAPTLDLVAQWARRLETAFGQAVGVLGGGQHQVLPLTVSTYDSAFLHLHRYGDRFGLIVFDEVHHLAAPGYLRAAESAFRTF